VSWTGRLKSYLPLALALVFVALGVWYVVAHWDDFAILGRLDVTSLLAIVATAMVYLVLGGWLLDTFLRRFGVALPWYRWLALFVMMTVGNIVTPVRGGTGLAAAYLKTAHGLQLTHFALVLAGTYIGGVIVNTAMGLVAIAISYATTGWFNPWVTGVAAAGLAGGLALFFIPAPKPSERWGWRLVVKAIAGWHELIRDRRLLARVLLLSLVMNLVHIGTYWLTYRSLGLGIGPIETATIVSMGNLGSMISLTPASLGPYDVVVVTVAMTFGLSGPEGTAALLVVRVVHLAVTFALACVFALCLRAPRNKPTDGGPSSDGV
jgi:uncharacterized membrane protein YbhN (UPF0104 family)